eukprot:s1407_g11.t1
MARFLEVDCKNHSNKAAAKKRFAFTILDHKQDTQDGSTAIRLRPAGAASLLVRPPPSQSVFNSDGIRGSRGARGADLSTRKASVNWTQWPCRLQRRKRKKRKIEMVSASDRGAQG